MNKEHIANLEERLRQAMLSSDVEVLDELLAESLVFTAPRGEVISKQTDLDCHKAKLQRLVELNPSDQSIVMYDNFAVVTVKMQLIGLFKNNPIDGIYCYTRVWADMNGKWQVVAGHVSSIA